MKIVDIKAYDLVIPYKVHLNPPWAPGKTIKNRKFTLVAVYTDSGIVGYGGGNGHIADKILKVVKPLFVGNSPYMIERYIRVLNNVGNVWSVEIALWDVIGKAAGLPLYQLWGAAKDKVVAYASTYELNTPADRAKQALHYLEKGFRAVKLRIHSPTLEEDLDHVDAVIDAVGNKMEIMVDANQAMLSIPTIREGPKWDYRRAYNTAKELEKRGVVWLEEPLERWHLDDLARLRNNTEIYIAGGERNIALHEFRWAIEKGSYDIIQPDVVYESLSQVRKIKHLCEAYNIHFIPHHGGSAIGLVATLHLLCTYSGWSYMEYMYDPPCRTIENYQCLEGIITTPILIDNDGNLTPPKKPGLGIDVDESLIEEYRMK